MIKLLIFSLTDKNLNSVLGNFLSNISIAVSLKALRKLAYFYFFAKFLHISYVNYHLISHLIQVFWLLTGRLFHLLFHWSFSYAYNNLLNVLSSKWRWMKLKDFSPNRIIFLFDAERLFMWIYGSPCETLLLKFLQFRKEQFNRPFESASCIFRI